MNLKTKMKATNMKKRMSLEILPSEFPTLINELQELKEPLVVKQPSSPTMNTAKIAMPIQSHSKTTKTGRRKQLPRRIITRAPKSLRKRMVPSSS